MVHGTLWLDVKFGRGSGWAGELTKGQCLIESPSLERNASAAGRCTLSPASAAVNDSCVPGPPFPIDQVRTQPHPQHLETQSSLWRVEEALAT